MAKPKHILLVAILLALFTGCACTDKDHCIVRQGDKFYIVKKQSIIHKENGCISFQYSETNDENYTSVEVCGTYTIEN